MRPLTLVDATWRLLTQTRALGPSCTEQGLIWTRVVDVKFVEQAGDVGFACWLERRGSARRVLGVGVVAAGGGRDVALARG